jgi:PAS domain S-box-containing protein
MEKGRLFSDLEESFVDFWLFIVVNTTILALLINILSLHYGTNAVAPHLLYIPIVIAAYWYPQRGILYAGIVSSIYIILVYLITGGVMDQLAAACITCFVLLGVAAVVSSLASHMRKSEIKYRGIFKHSEAGIGLVSLLDLSIKEVNTRFAGILEYLPVEISSIPFSEIWVEPTDKDRFFRELRTQGNVENVETRFRAKSGAYRWVLLSAGMLPENQFVCTIVDITDRKKAEESLLIRDHAISSSINAICIFNLDFNITYVNHSLVGMMGFADEQGLIGKNIRPFIAVQNGIDIIRKELEANGSWFGESTLKKSDLSTFPVLLWVNLVRDEKGKSICIMASFIDITDRKQMEVVKRNALEQIEKNIEQFAILGDHIRNPLAVIVGLSSLAPGDITDKIILQAREIDRIVTQLDMGWIESEKVREFIKRYYMVSTIDPAGNEPGKGEAK